MTREEAINMVQGARQYLTAGNPIWDVKKIDEALNMAIEALSAEAVQGWIPCSERLPEIDETLRICDQISEDVLGTDTYGNIRHVYLTKCGCHRRSHTSQRRNGGDDGKRNVIHYGS